MGLSVSNIHVFVGDSGVMQEQVSEVAGRAGLTSPIEAGWCSFFPAEFELEQAAGSLHEQLSRPVVGFLTHDSDVAIAQLLVDGQRHELKSAHPEMFDMIGLPVTDPVIFEGTYLHLYGDLERWTTALGKGEPNSILEELGNDPETPFAEGLVSPVLAAVGMDPERFFMAHRFLVSDEPHGPGWIATD